MRGQRQAGARDHETERDRGRQAGDAAAEPGRGYGGRTGSNQAEAAREGSPRRRRRCGELPAPEERIPTSILADRLQRLERRRPR